MSAPLILAIESSCDETAAAIVSGRQVLGSSVASQIEKHAVYGGVVPEIASRQHMEALIPVTSQALNSSGVKLSEIDAIAATYGPGLAGALLCGLSFAKGLAVAQNKPLLAVNHIHAHICANYIAHTDLEPPFACLVVSGGHSHLVRVNGYSSYTLLTRTRDDAAGEAFDKAARMIGLPYPGGPLLDALAESGDDRALTLTRPKAGGEFSFSGLKSSLSQALNRLKKEGREIEKADIAASFRSAVVDELLRVSIPIVQKEGLSTLALAGGVASNRLLRRRCAQIGCETGIDVLYPPLELCTDNAAMVGCAATHVYNPGKDYSQALFVNAEPSINF